MRRAVLTTARLTLRPIEAGDAGAVIAALGAYDTAQWLRPIPHPYTEADFAALLQLCRPGHHWMITCAGDCLGLISLEPALGYWLAPAARGQGYSAEAARAVLAAHFADPEAETVESYYMLGNAASAGVLTGLGFVPTRKDTVFAEARGTEVPVQRMALARAAFATAQPLVIETARLRLDPLTAADTEGFRALVTRPEVGRMLFRFPADWNLAAAEEFVAGCAWTGTPPFRLAIRLKGDAAGDLIGTIGLAALDAPEIFYFLAPEQAGQGYASEAVAGFADHVTRYFALPRLTAEVFTDNPGSARVLEKAGFRQTGTGMGASEQRQGLSPLWHYERLTPPEG
jgi:RimJ/RimL family protein N-acetyltransferase